MWTWMKHRNEELRRPVGEVLDGSFNTVAEHQVSIAPRMSMKNHGEGFDVSTLLEILNNFQLS